MEQSTKMAGSRHPSPKFPSEIWLIVSGALIGFVGIAFYQFALNHCALLPAELSIWMVCLGISVALAKLSRGKFSALGSGLIFTGAAAVFFALVLYCVPRLNAVRDYTGCVEIGFLIRQNQRIGPNHCANRHWLLNIPNEPAASLPPDSPDNCHQRMDQFEDETVLGRAYLSLPGGTIGSDVKELVMCKDGVGQTAPVADSKCPAGETATHIHAFIYGSIPEQMKDEVQPLYACVKEGGGNKDTYASRESDPSACSLLGYTPKVKGPHTMAAFE